MSKSLPRRLASSVVVIGGGAAAGATAVGVIAPTFLSFGSDWGFAVELVGAITVGGLWGEFRAWRRDRGRD